MHLRYRRVPARATRRTARPLSRRSDHFGGLAAAGPHLVLRRRTGLHRRLGGALGHRPRLCSRRRSARRRIGFRRGQRRRALRAGTGRSGRALVGRASDRIVHRDDPEQRTRASRPGTAGGDAAQVAALAELVADDLGQPLTRLRVDGGLTRSAVLMQAQADLARIPVEVYPSAHATPLGAAACARMALDPAATSGSRRHLDPPAHLRTAVDRRPCRRSPAPMEGRHRRTRPEGDPT